MRFVVISGFPNIYPDQAVPAYLQSLVSDYPIYREVADMQLSVPKCDGVSQDNLATFRFVEADRCGVRKAHRFGPVAMKLKRRILS